MNIKEVFLALQEVNESEHELEYPAHLLTDGWCFKIMWQNTTIWSSEDEDREFFEDKNEYEPLGQFIIKRQIEELERMKKDIQRGFRTK